MKNKPSLAITHPKVAEQWHPTLNGDLTATDVSHGSNKKVWWKCEKGEDHMWKANICSRAQGSGCSICSGKKVVKSNCLATLDPDLAKEWHPTLNGKLTPYEVGIGSVKKVWWKCEKGDDHEWIASVQKRTSGTGCPICSNKKIVLSNCLATVVPKLAKQWHPTKNGSITPYDVAPSSTKRIWWKCDKSDDHEWYTTINNRYRIQEKRISACPYCSSQKTTYSTSLKKLNPKLAGEWHPTKNGNLKPEHVNPFSNKKVWWKCEKGDDHEWIATVANRSEGKGCSVCHNRTVVESNSLKYLRPDLSKEWHPTKNGNLKPEDVNIQSRKKVWWKCEKGDDHEWQAEVGYRNNNNSSCPICLNQITIPSTSLASTNPKLLKQWDYEKNQNISPYELVEGSGIKVWWKCEKDNNHSWKSTIVSRKTSECPFCKGSNGEIKIEKLLRKLNVKFELQKTFEDMKFSNKLRCDFYLIDQNTVIEFNGIQHYQAIDFFGGKRKFKKQVRNDRIKKEYCLDNNIGFEIIKYDENIEDRIKNILKLKSTDKM